MKVNFKGLYIIPGSQETARGKGKTLQEIQEKKFEEFLDDTRDFYKKGDSYYNKETGDYYLQVKPDYESMYKEYADLYRIDTYKVGWETSPRACAMLKKRLDFYNKDNNNFKIPKNNDEPNNVRRLNAMI